MLIWEWYRYDELPRDVLYDILALRQRVFVLEQSCAYVDADGVDRDSHHLLGRSADGRIAAYLRVVAPNVKYDEPSLGRVITSPEARGTGAGKALMAEGIARASALYPGQPLRIGAQRYLLRFYESFGFVSTGYEYDEDGIPHTEMLRPG